jgi:hypothetical protein
MCVAEHTLRTETAQPLAVSRSLSVALDGSMVVAANNAGTAYVWRMLRGASLTTHFEPLHKLRAHQGESQGQLGDSSEPYIRCNALDSVLCWGVAASDTPTGILPCSRAVRHPAA